MKPVSMSTEPVIKQAITMLLSGRIDNQCAKSLRQIASSAELAEIFVRDLIARKTEGGEALEVILPDVMRILEGIADRSESTACIFMAYLWPIASMCAGMHDVSDSIDLWLTMHRESEVADHLKHIVNTSSSEIVKRHFQKLVE
jgi:hypothetical protein